MFIADCVVTSESRCPSCADALERCNDARTSRTSSLMSSALDVMDSARRRISAAKIPNPLPESPARVASKPALIASRSERSANVWIDSRIWPIASTSVLSCSTLFTINLWFTCVCSAASKTEDASEATWVDASPSWVTVLCACSTSADCSVALASCARITRNISSDDVAMCKALTVIP